MPIAEAERHQQGYRPTGDLGFRVAEDLLCSQVPTNDVSCAVGRDNSVSGGTSHRPVVLLALPQRLFCTLLFGDVTGDTEDPRDIAEFVNHGALRRKEGYLFPFSCREMLLVRYRLPGGDDASVAFHDRPGFIGREQEGVVVSDHLGGALPREARCRIIEKKVTSLQILDVDRVRRPIHHHPQEILRFPDLLLRLPQLLFRALAGFFGTVHVVADLQGNPRYQRTR